ncbi:interleukin-31 [Echinops telfairi]|uniref:Interleukin-31 n=1 Tax=Echinops telfairi TaxID=9371 RepID=A0AC55DLN5_ECHTE|nr:interleukin-31 [Echinops telfairi]
MAPVDWQSSKDWQTIIMELQNTARGLWENYEEEKGLPASSRYTLPCLTSDSQPPNNINSSAILSYFRAIRTAGMTLPHHTRDIEEVIGQLEKIRPQNSSEIQVSVPADAFEWKCFILTVFQQFSKCMDQIHTLETKGQLRPSG